MSKLVRYLLAGIWVASVSCVMVCQTRAAMTMPSCCHETEGANCCEDQSIHVSPAVLDQAASAMSAPRSWAAVVPMVWMAVSPRFVNAVPLHLINDPGDPPGAYVLTDSPPQAPPLL